MNKALIVFPDEWLAYSPTILNFAACLKGHDYDVRILAFDNGDYAREKELNCDYIPINRRLYAWLIKLHLCRLVKFILLLWWAISRARLHEPSRYDLIVGVDSIGFLVTRLFARKAIFLSLEIRRDAYFLLSHRMGIHHLVIQTEERRRYLLGRDERVPVSYIQNAPIYRDRALARARDPRRLVFMGNLLASHGVEQCINALEHLESGFTLTLKGSIAPAYLAQLTHRYRHLLETGRLVIDTTYVVQDKIGEFLAGFGQGLCIYDLNQLGKGDFNFISCPSGKLFNYFAAGLPVVALNILGLKCVERYRAGVLVDSPDASEIARAARKIAFHYASYAECTHHAANANDFRTAFDAFFGQLSIDPPAGMRIGSDT